MEDQRKYHIEPEEPNQLNYPKQQHIHNLPRNDVENINCTNKGRGLLLANKPWIALRNGKDARKDPEAQQSYFT